ncbi:hypothetical protein RF11_03628 [Thelohanellus kitauei]|uniref:Uncharacterized protein n=1 Tax=Thelohanellus kitauei TaxID=669202 RepID=A0A0C2MZ93_THEKT|nr:hypothetical protein RF11_03628 [Thelohanellus kitauei]
MMEGGGLYNALRQDVLRQTGCAKTIDDWDVRVDVLGQFSAYFLDSEQKISNLYILYSETMTWEDVVVAQNDISITGYITKYSTVKTDILTTKLSYTDEGEKGYIITKLLLDYNSEIGKQIPPIGFVASEIPLRVSQVVHGVTQKIDVYVNYIAVGFKKSLVIVFEI